MIITYHGLEYFKVSHGDTTLAFNPISKKSKATKSPASFGADIAFISCRHPDFDGVSQVSRGSSTPFVIDGPGAYEVGDIVVQGFDVVSKYDGRERHIALYQVKLEGMNIVFLGPLGHSELGSELLQALGDIDVLFVPIGDDELLSPSEASKLGVKLEARCVIPMHYDTNALNAFLKEESAEEVKPIEKLTLKRKDLLEMEGTVVVLKA